MLFYVTKWVTTRGILLLEGSKPERIRHSPRSWTQVHGAGRRMARLGVGTEAFTSLKEAEADALKRFKERHRRAEAEVKWTRNAMAALKEGLPVLVHTKPERVSGCQPFTRS